MELEHRFEVPVGIEKAWAALIDIQQIGTCFPGAHLDAIDGDEFSGSVKLKIAGLRMTYKGTARFVEKDHELHRARIEATGNAGESETAAMLVTATASAVAPNRTAVDLVTTLSLTGRRAAFGRPVMVEAGNFLVSRFADCVSTKLSGRDAGGATLVDVTDPDEVAAAVVASEQAAVARTAPALAAGRPRVRREVPGDARALLGGQAIPSLQKAVPIVCGAIGLLLTIKLFRRSPKHAATED
ncbi:SRPBCC family protein [Nakamurella flava]|uniref:SRPBCC family protein n=1 Tax=Nakamurella flava TaxID=2576308 RepID=UPI00140D9892|nr:SRPBCC family protein [Nakamurella flava]